MPSITTWTRLEPRSRHQDMSAFLQARLADPLWHLSVQLSLGEMVGQDAAFPISASYTVTVHPMIAAADVDPQLPVDALLGAEPGASGPTLQDASELAAQLLDHGMSSAGVDAFVAAHPVGMPPDGSVDDIGGSYLRLLAGRLPDPVAWGPLLRSAVSPGGALPSTLSLSAADATAALAAAAAWLHDLDTRQPTGTATWQTSTLHHDASVAITSTAGGYADAQLNGWDGDELQWYHFDLDVPSGSAPAYPPLRGVDAASGTISGSGIPHPLSFPGAPNPRYWAMEDGGVNLAGLEVEAADLARLLLIGFETVTAPDWYLQPLPLPTGALHTLILTVTNTFGETSTVPLLAPSLPGPGEAAGQAVDWVMFRPETAAAHGSGALDGLLLPSLVTELRQGPLESVLLVRDDVYDRAWAQEIVVAGADGRPLDRLTATAIAAADPISATSAAGPAVAPDDNSQVQYRLESPVPAWAYPLVRADSPRPLLQLALADPPQPPMGALLTELRGQQVQQQEIPPWQASLSRDQRLGRGPGGQLLTWIGRVYRWGGSAATTSLDFDLTISAPQAGAAMVQDRATWH